MRSVVLFPECPKTPRPLMHRPSWPVCHVTVSGLRQLSHLKPLNSGYRNFVRTDQQHQKSKGFKKSIYC